jgi:hypothetical protein
MTVMDPQRASMQFNADVMRDTVHGTAATTPTDEGPSRGFISRIRRH